MRYGQKTPMKKKKKHNFYGSTRRILHQRGRKPKRKDAAERDSCRTLPK